MHRIYVMALLTGTLVGGAVLSSSEASAASFPEPRLEVTISGSVIDLVQFRPDEDDETRRRRRRDGDGGGGGGGGGRDRDEDEDRGRDRDRDRDDGDRDRGRDRDRDDGDRDRGRDRDRDRDRDDGDRGRGRDRDRDRDYDRGRRGDRPWGRPGWGGPPPPWAFRQCFPRRPIWTPWGWRCRGYRPNY